MTDYRDALRKIRKEIASDERGFPDAAAPPDHASPADRDRWHDDRMKAALNVGNITVARDHASALQRSDSPRLRALASERLRLMAAPPRVLRTDDRNLSPGVVHVPGLGSVAVLGRYEAYGQRQGLTQALLILKKAPEELDDAVRNARPLIIERLGAGLCDLILRLPAFRDVDFIVPTPPDAGRFAARLHHPPIDIAREVARFALIPALNDVLVRTRSTRKLKDLDRRERQFELAGSMAVADRRSPLVDGASVLVLDDIVTWGTHFQEASRVLRAAGAGEIKFVAVATAHGYVTPA